MRVSCEAIILREADPIRGICGAHGGRTRLPKCGIFEKLVGGAGCVGGAGKRVDGVFLGRPQIFRYQCRPVDDCSPGQEGLAQDVVTRGVERFMAKWIAAEEVRGGLRHTVVCPNVTGRTKGEDGP